MGEQLRHRHRVRRATVLQSTSSATTREEYTGGGETVKANRGSQYKFPRRRRPEPKSDKVGFDYTAKCNLEQTRARTGGMRSHRMRRTHEG